MTHTSWGSANSALLSAVSLQNSSTERPKEPPLTRVTVLMPGSFLGTCHFRNTLNYLPGTLQEAGSTSKAAAAKMFSTAPVARERWTTGIKEMSQNLILPINCLGLRRLHHKLPLRPTLSCRCLLPSEIRQYWLLHCTKCLCYNNYYIL